MNELKMMEEIRKINIYMNDNLVFSKTFANPSVAHKFMINWIMDYDFRAFIDYNLDMEVPKVFLNGFASRKELEELIQNGKDSFVFNTDTETYKIEEKESYLTLAFEQPNGEMIFG